jgi:Ca2+-binding RTX toxin-like protein
VPLFGVGQKKDMSMSGVSADLGTGNDTWPGPAFPGLPNIGNDSIFGNSGNDCIDGGIGNDWLLGGTGIDTVDYSAETGDLIVTSERATLAGGNDTLGQFEVYLGGSGNDSLVGAGVSYNETFNGGAGNDTISASLGNDSLAGDAGDDRMDGGQHTDTLFGGEGNDWLIGGTGNDRLDGGSDTDTASYGGSTGGVTVDLAAERATGLQGNDTLLNIENVVGSDGNDSLLGDSLANVLYGGIGDDTLDGGAGNDWVSYAGAATAVTVNLNASNSSGAHGNDSLIGIENVLGGGSADSILGDSLANLLDGANGNDTLNGGNDNDTLLGGIGNDSLLGGNGDDSLLAGDGNDWLQGQDGNDTLVSGGSNDTLIGDDGADSLRAAGGGAFTLSGGDGDDTIFAGESDGNFFTRNIAQGGAGNDSVSGNDQSTSLLGGSGNDTLTSDGEYADLDGQEGDDLILSGSAEYQNLLGGSGNDTLLSSTGIGFRLEGQAGADSLVATPASQMVFGGEGDDTLVGGSGNGQNLYGQDVDPGVVDLGNDSIVGGTGYYQGLYGGDGQDTLVAGGGIFQELYGEAGNDSLLGSAMAELLDGGDGDDTISGGAGNDLLDFGAGNENYLRGASETGNDTLIGGDGNDTLDLQANWSFLSESGGFSLYQDEADTIYAQSWEQVVCFAEGTRIVTPNGEDAVENLRAGDMVLAMRDGQAGFEPLRWVGFMDIAVPRYAVMAAKTAPILIKAGAIGPGMPARDLRVSPDHAMEIDGHLIPAKHLVNGSSIIQEVWCKRVRYFHLELEAHGLLLSEGTWSESYLDDGNRHAFNNAAMTGLFLDFEVGRSKGQYDHRACLPVLRQGLKLDEIHGRLALRAGELVQPEKGHRRG